MEWVTGRGVWSGLGLTLRPPPWRPCLPGITGILMSAAGLPVCLTRPPRLVLHPPPVSKSEIKSIPGVSNTSRKTTKKQAKKGISLLVKRSPGRVGVGHRLGSQPSSVSTTEGHARAFCASVSASAKWAN